MSSEVKWIKIVTDIFDDEKILLIESMPDCDSIIVVWFKLLCLAGKQNNGGVFMLSDRIAYTDEMFATIFRRPVNTVRLALKTFEQYGMIEIINNTVTIPNWEKHQALDQLESKKAYMREYMRNKREKQKQLALSAGEVTEQEETQDNCKANCKTNSKANVSCLDKEIDKEIDTDIIIGDKSPKKQPKRFVPPSVDEVRSYCQERGNNVDAERFVDYYTSNGWHVGKNPMKDWRAAVRTWERHGWNGYGYGGKSQKPVSDPYANSSFTKQDIDMIFSPEFQGLAPKKPKGKEAQNASFDIEDFKRLKNKFPDDDA